MAKYDRSPHLAIALTLSAALLFPACSSRPPRALPIGEAYVGPAELKLRADLPMESATVATVHHGDRLEILQQRRTVFLRVRAPNGAEGWTDAHQLLSARDMSALRDLAARAARMPSQGLASSYSDLRLHSEPSSDAPSFFLVKEGEKFDVLASQVVPRASAPRPPLVPPAPKKQKAPPRKTSKNQTIPPPPLPKPPGPPPDWLELSGVGAGAPPEAANPAPDASAEKSAPTDNWSLVRTSGGQSGWVLTRHLYMAIPDEVAQYAEGHRIVSYFPLADVRDGDSAVHQWLWTTIAGPAGPYDFDSFRVFVWSLRHHRYETAYIERNIKGHSPVLIGDVELSSGTRKAPGPATAYAGFSICEEKPDGSLRLRDYAFLNPTVRFAGERDCPARQPLSTSPTPSPATPAPAAPQSQSLITRLKNKWHSLTRPWFTH
jgi:hypothetical protein